MCVKVAALDGDHYGLAQHAFIKSIECDGRSALPWINLGALYLTANDIELANKSFTRYTDGRSSRLSEKQPRTALLNTVLARKT